MRYRLFAGFLVLCTAFAGWSAAEDSAKESLPLEASWRASETATEKEKRLQAIEEATGHLPGFQKKKARSRLLERTSPVPSLAIAVEGSEVTITSGDNRLQLELGASPVEISGGDGQAELSAKMDGPKLIVEADGEKGQRKTVYSVNGDRLSVEVTMAGARLAEPVKYVSTYTRME